MAKGATAKQATPRGDAKKEKAAKPSAEDAATKKKDAPQKAAVLKPTKDLKPAEANKAADAPKAAKPAKGAATAVVAEAPKPAETKAKAGRGAKKDAASANVTPAPSEPASRVTSARKEEPPQENPNDKMFAGAQPVFLKKLELYRTSFLKCVSRVHDGDLSASAAVSIIFLPIKELLEAMPKAKGETAAEAKEYAAKFAEYVYNDILLCLCFMGRAKAANGAEEKLEPLAVFLYSHAMRVDYLLENKDKIKKLENLDSKKVIPKAPRMVLRLWENLLSLVMAKDRKMRIAFSTITFHFMKHACQDEIEISKELFAKHIDTFLLILPDPNKEIRYRCLQLLENFQDERVKKEMMAHLEDPAAAVRLAAANFMEVPEDVEAAVPLLRYLIARIGDVSKEVRAGVYKRLGGLYQSIPVEMCNQIMTYGLAEEVQNVKGAFLHMMNAWINHCGGLCPFIADLMAQSDDLSILEDALSFFMKNTDFLSTFSLQVDDAKTQQKENEAAMDVDEDPNTIKAYMKRFVTLSPAEVMVVNVFYQSHASPDEVKLINIIDVISYSHFLLNTFCNMPQEVEQAPTAPLHSEFDDEADFMDAVEADESAAVHKYTEEEAVKLKEQYNSMRLVCHTFRALLIISHCHGIEDNYQVALAETMCDKILLYGPVRTTVTGLMSDVISQTSLGNNSYSYALPSRWLKAGFTFAATSLMRYIYARKFRLEGKFIGDDTGMEKRHFEVSMTRKALSIISDIKDPFQTSGVSNISIRREELERMELKKIKEFDPSSYSIEHLNVFDAKLSEQMQQTCTQQAELEAVKNAKSSGKAEKEVLRKQEDALISLFEKQMAFATIIRQHLKDRWTRIMAIVEAFLGLTKSLCSEDAGLAEFPTAILLPQMTFFCSTVVQWQDQDITDQYCDVLTSKCLGNWCMLNNGKMELWRQLNAFHVALKGALVILEGCVNQAAGDPEALTDALKQRIEMQTLRCEMYMTTLTDLLVTNVDLMQPAPGEDAANRELIEDLKETVWGLINTSVKSSKYVQSVAIRQGCKLLLTEFLKNKYEENPNPDAEANPETQQQDEVAVLRMRGLLEIAFVAPVAERYAAIDFKFVKSTKYVPITPEDKNTIMSTCALYPTLSFRHLRNFHKVLEQVLMRSIHHAMQLELPMGGFSHLISFMVQTILHKSPLYFSMESFAKYFKWVLLITIDKGTALAEKAGFIQLVAALISLFIKRNVSALVYKFGLPQNIAITDDEPKSMSDLCALANPALALLDLRDMKVLLNYVLTQQGLVKVKSNIKVLTDLVELVSNQMMKLARWHLGTLENAAGAVSVEAGEPPKIVFCAEDNTAFSDLVDAYDAYISSLGPRELYAQLLEEDQVVTHVEVEKPVVSRKSSRAGKGSKGYQCDSDGEGSDGSDAEFDDDEYDDD